MKVTLTGRTSRGKQIVKAQSSAWVVLDTQMAVLFAGSAPGPWHFVAPRGVNPEPIMSETRWVHGTHDAKFNVSLGDWK